MKAVVMEIRGKWAAVLCENGEFRKVKKGNLKVGDSLDFIPESSGKILSIASFKRSLAASAAAVFLLTAGTIGVYAYNNVLPSSYVSLDINPSLEYSLNRKNHVIRVKGLNEEGREIADALSSHHNASLEEVLAQTKLLLTESNYLSEDAMEYLLVNVSADSTVQTENLENEVLSVFHAEEARGELKLILSSSTLQEHKAASSFGISTGTYRQIQSIKAGSEKNNNGVSQEEKSSSVQASDILKYKDYSVLDFLESSGQLPLSTNTKPTSEPSTSSFSQQSPSSEEGKSSKKQENSSVKGTTATEESGQTQADTNKKSLKNTQASQAQTNTPADKGISNTELKKNTEPEKKQDNNSQHGSQSQAQENADNLDTANASSEGNSNKKNESMQKEAPIQDGASLQENSEQVREKNFE